MVGGATRFLAGVRDWARVLVAAFGFVLGAAPAFAQSDLEYAVKATYLYKFTPFVGWPREAFGAPTASLNICVVGRDPFGSLLDRAVGGQYLDARPIAVRRMAVADRDASCHVMYVGSSTEQSAAQALMAVRGRPVLTVTDSAQGPDARGIVHFVVHANRVRFTIDNRAAAENGLVLSSKLLSLALSIDPGP